MKTRLDTSGFDEYLEKLARAGENIDEITDEALQDGGEILRDGMQRRAPVATGRLKSRISMTPVSSDGNYHSVKVGIFGVNRKSELYFFYSEYGHAKRAARPYIRPTFDEDMKKARAAMRQKFIDRGAL
jgi:HK97 gp10 family phage protein